MSRKLRARYVGVAPGAIIHTCLRCRAEKRSAVNRRGQDRLTSYKPREKKHIARIRAGKIPREIAQRPKG